MQKYLLEVNNLSKNFGGLKAVDGVSFKVRENKIKAIIGPNGAGKSTLFKLISGFYVPDEGEKKFKGRNFCEFRPHQIVDLGITMTFQELSNFGDLTILQNVMIGRHTKSKGEFLSSGLGLGLKEQEEKIKESALKYLNLVGFSFDRVNELAGNLSYGEQKLLEIVRAMATEPELIMLDEPVSGLNEKEIKDMFDMIKNIQNMGVTILLVEHDMNFVMEISDSILVLNYGVKIKDGTPKEVKRDPLVIKAYLGEEINV